MSSTESLPLWYVLRVTYQRELIAKRRMDELGVESFVPTRSVRERGANGRVVVARRALVHNYIFVHATREVIDALKQRELPYLRYVMHTINDTYTPMVVPEAQMRSFILVTGSEDERLMVVDCQAAELKAGTRVRVVGGIFAGAEGVLTKLSGLRDRRVVVRIDGVAAVATPKIEKELLEIIS